MYICIAVRYQHDIILSLYFIILYGYNTRGSHAGGAGIKLSVGIYIVRIRKLNVQPRVELSDCSSKNLRVRNGVQKVNYIYLYGYILCTHTFNLYIHTRPISSRLQCIV